MNLQTVPLWPLVLAAVVSWAVLAAVTLKIMPPPLRRGAPGWTLVLVLVLVLVSFGVSVALSPDHRGGLWFATVVPLTMVGPLLWLGPLPADMPSNLDPRVVEHPQYEEVRRRGRWAGLAYAVLLTVVLIGTGVFVHGL